MQRKYLLPLAILAILAVGGLGYTLRNQIFKGTVKSVQTNLTAEEQKQVEAKIAEAQNKIKEIGTPKDDQAKQEKINLYMTMGYQQYSLGRLAEAEKSYNAAKDLNSTDANIWAALYQVQNDMKDYSAARKSINSAVYLTPSNSDYWRWYITLEYERFGTEPAKIHTLYTDAIVKTGQSPDVYTSYARYLESIGDVESAANQWRIAGQVNPSAKAAYQSEIDRLEKILGIK